MTIYNQSAVIHKINLYLEFRDRDVRLSTGGCCHGFTLLWLTKISEGEEQENWFYSTLKNIVHCETIEDFAAIETEIEKFISYIRWAQSPDKFVNTIHQLDVDKLLELPREFSLTYLFTHRQLQMVLEKILENDKMICLSSPNHTIGVFRKKGKNFLFDPNYKRGQPKQFYDVNSLKLEIIRCFFEDKILPGRKFPIQINVTSNEMDVDCVAEKIAQVEKENEMVDELIKDDQEIDQAGYQGLTNLYLACENRDSEEVKKLVAHGADPNQIGRHDWTTLQFAADQGYSDIVETLINCGAKVNLRDQRGRTPLFFAAQNGYEETVRILLEKGGRISFKKHLRNTPLQGGIKKNQWQVVAVMLCYVANIEMLSAKDIKDLRIHRNDVMDGVSKAWGILTLKEKTALGKTMRSLYHLNLRLTLFGNTRLTAISPISGVCPAVRPRLRS